MTDETQTIPPRARWTGRALLLLVLGLLVANVVWIARNCGSLRALGPGQQAPDFSLESMSGDRVRLSDLRGRVVLLDFWSVTCEPCWTALKHTQEVANRFAGQPVTVLAIHTKGGKRHRGDVQKAITALKLRFPVLLDNGRVSNRYTVRVLPTTVLLDQRGKVTQVWRGITDVAVLSKAIRDLLKK